MKRNAVLLKNLVQEYETLMSEIGKGQDIKEDIDWLAVEAKLHLEAGWTEEGSQHLVQLVQDNGSFVLRNALALALAANVEDGALNF